MNHVHVHKLDACFNEVSVTINDIGNAFLLLYNQSTHDEMYIIDIKFNSGDIRYTLYITSSLDALTTDTHMLLFEQLKENRQHIKNG